MWDLTIINKTLNDGSVAVEWNMKVNLNFLKVTVAIV